MGILDSSLGGGSYNPGEIGAKRSFAGRKMYPVGAMSRRRE